MVIMAKEIELQTEYETYKAHKEDLLLKDEGKFVLIKGREIIDVYSSYEDALKAGLKRFGNVPFLIKRVQREDEVFFFYTHVA